MKRAAQPGETCRPSALWQTNKRRLRHRMRAVAVARGGDFQRGIDERAGARHDICISSRTMRLVPVWSVHAENFGVHNARRLEAFSHFRRFTSAVVIEAR